MSAARRGTDAWRRQAQAVSRVRRDRCRGRCAVVGCRSHDRRSRWQVIAAACSSIANPVMGSPVPSTCGWRACRDLLPWPRQVVAQAPKRGEDGAPPDVSTPSRAKPARHVNRGPYVIARVPRYQPAGGQLRVVGQHRTVDPRLELKPVATRRCPKLVFSPAASYPSPANQRVAARPQAAAQLPAIPEVKAARQKRPPGLPATAPYSAQVIATVSRRKDPMLTRLLHLIRHNVIALIALFVALGGTSYAALNLPAGSVGTRQLKNRSVTASQAEPVKRRSQCPCLGDT